MVAPKSSNRRRGLLHRCRLFLTWACRSAQGWGCSPIKRDRELGSVRCETVRIISTGNVKVSEGKDLLVREEQRFEASGSPVIRQGRPGSYASRDKS